MLDLIFISFFVATFFAGFIVGAKFGTLKALLNAIGDWLKSLVD